MSMFGKRRQHSSRASSTPREEQQPPSCGAGEAAAPAGGDPSARPASRPDASAVLNRQPTPPVRPDAQRRAGPAPAVQSAQRPLEPASARHLKVGRDIEISGTIRACERLVVEGRVDADLTDSKTLEITATGAFKGSAVIDIAEIAGCFEGDLTVRERLSVRSSGRVQGTVRYRSLQIESGGRIGGTLVELGEGDIAAAGTDDDDDAGTVGAANGAARPRQQEEPASGALREGPAED